MKETPYKINVSMGNFKVTCNAGKGRSLFKGYKTVLKFDQKNSESPPFKVFA